MSAPVTAAPDAADPSARTAGTADAAAADGTVAHPPTVRHRLTIAATALFAGACLALSVPPWGWWPLAFVGVAVWFRLVSGQERGVRFARTWLVGAAWLFPALLWMWDLTPPGYVVACAAYAGYFGVAVALAPDGPRTRWVGFPAAVVLGELARWSFPFGGVPLAHLAMSQADAPLRYSVRIAGPLTLVALVVLGGMALAAASQRQWRPAAVAAAVVAVVGLVGFLAPSGRAVDTIDVALVQGGGEQRTRAGDVDNAVVFGRHLEATGLVRDGVDLVLWPENVVNTRGPLAEHPWHEELQELAADLDATLSVGIFETIDDTTTRNAQIVFDRDGNQVDRFDKVRIVPFGEFVPFRGLLERIAGGAGLPQRDVEAGRGPGLLESETASLGVLISWEVFFANRGRDATEAGAQILTNPTNGSSYWLTQVQTQQVASSRLRALESGRWVIQSAPTGFTGVVDPDGRLLARTSLEEQAVIHHTVELREGTTWAVAVGVWPMLVLALAAYPAGWLWDRRAWRDATTQQPRHRRDGGSGNGGPPAAGIGRDKLAP
jgi:apolipoprotein N-acyltransferase